MALITLDFETMYDQDYSLSKMSEVDYIKDARFEAIMCSVKVGDTPTEVYVGRDIKPALGRIDWSTSAVLAHNIRFDGGILAWHYGHVPRMYLDTLSMSRATTHWTIGRSSLAKVAEYLGLPPKGDEVIKAKGKRLRDFTSAELELYEKYCARDTDLCHAVFQKLRPRFRASELAIIDMIARMFILPQVRLNASVLQQNYDRVLADKAEALARVSEIPRSVFSSQPQFAKLLQEHGVEVPMKTSPTTGDQIPALAKGDWAFKELCADDTLPPFVQLLLAARLSEKSTLEETRSRNMLRLAETPWRKDVGWAPIPLKYSGARTHRLSGDGGANWQNLPRGSLLRTAIEAPAGWRIVHRDASQIEARMTAWLAKCNILLDAFAEQRDVYCEFASIIYDREVTPEDKLERFVGKTAILGLGYGCGAEKFQKMLFIGNGGISLKLNIETADVIVTNYRAVYHEIPALWQYFNYLLKQIVKLSRRVRYDRMPYGVDYSHIPIDVDYDCFVLPNDLRICYPELSQDPADAQMTYIDPNYTTPRYLYGAKACLGANTEVLTDHGWKPIIEVVVSDRLWDGIEWVTHDGVTFNGTQLTALVDGITMTPHHKVLTEIGWVDGAACEGYNRAAVWLSDSDAARWVAPDGYWSTASVGGSLRLRPGQADGLVDLLQGRTEIVRLSAVRNNCVGQSDTWDVETPSVLGMAVDGGPMQAANPPSLGELRGTGDYRVPRMAIVRDFLGRYGTDVQTRPRLGAQGQRGWIFTGELRVGDASQTGKQQAGQRLHTNVVWSDYGSGSVEAHRYRPYDTVVSPERRSRPVYDVVNAGPRNRFVVAGTQGPFIVHNCENISQALSRIIVTDIAVRMQAKTGYRPFLSTHDSLDLCVPEKDAEAIDQELARQFAYVPDWAEGLPLASSGGWGRNLTAAEREDNC